MKKPRAKRVKRPKHPGEIRAWRFALRLDQDVSALHRALDTAWALRNDLAAARAENGRVIRAAKEAGLVPPARLTKRDQEMVLAERRRRDPKGAGALHSLVVKNIADRVDEGWNRFWDALKERRPNVRPPEADPARAVPVDHLPPIRERGPSERRTHRAVHDRDVPA
ncbi:hypothetical protein IQ03_05246, partial [Gemmobacter caeni]|uniref:hypothetical protein n=1 Tax=Gemmobacter caeni TaxID=589035 RepID=UPI0011A50D13